MAKDRIKIIRTELQKIIKSAGLIENEMKEIPHQEIPYIPLKPKTEEYIAQSLNGFLGSCRDSRGVLYEIHIYRRIQ